MSKKALQICLILIAVFGIYGTLTAGDMSSFVNMGFSDDCRYFQFGQYGIDADSISPYAQIYTIDVQGNHYARPGVVEESYDILMQPGQSGLNALLKLYNENYTALSTYKVDPLQTGRLLYILVNGTNPLPVLEFRDFVAGNSWKVELYQKAAAEKTAASFHIDFEITGKNGKTQSYKVGNPDFIRDDVEEYRIRSIYTSPDDSSVIFVVEKSLNVEGNLSIRYMVETLKIN